jgi:uncharacterized protein (TIGR02391 family)
VKTVELLGKVMNFRVSLNEYYLLWGKSLAHGSPSFPQKNISELKQFEQLLNEKLGELWPYLYFYRKNWITADGANILNMAISDIHAIHKGDALRASLNMLDQIIGRIKSEDQNLEIIVSTTGAKHGTQKEEPTPFAYLENIHPYIKKGCSKLFYDGHYTNAIEEAAKAIFEYLRQKTGLKTDGCKLAQTAFSEKNPMLTFGDLNEENARNEQIGFMNMLCGIALGYRNPLTHSHGRMEDKYMAFEFLVMASLICRRVDEARFTDNGNKEY